MDFDHKINKCMMKNCYNDIMKPRDDVLECRKDCKSGIQNADTFVKNATE
jgi:hypothetical protein